ncbi:MAG: hypothetical protein A2V77_18295 [Anaeromyxobacter sp. RBG_16_69_14]|nr:MAG: hypothetical protein A2V77_18295 [Anaeromyxobacter sp. RBG_16_69_14]
MPHELTLEMGGAEGEFSPPLEAPQGAGHQLTAAAVPLRALIRRQPEVAALLLPGSAVGHDLMTFVGLEVFVRLRPSRADHPRQAGSGAGSCYCAGARPLR